MAILVTLSQLREGCIATHCGNFIKGHNGDPDVEQYKSSVFIRHKTKKGHEVWQNSGVCTPIFIRVTDAAQAGRDLAAAYDIPYVELIGSLHNKKIVPKKTAAGPPLQLRARAIRLRPQR